MLILNYLATHNHQIFQLHKLNFKLSLNMYTNTAPHRTTPHDTTPHNILSKPLHRYQCCMHCAEFSPKSPWATMKSRKFDADTWEEHRRTLSHTAGTFEFPIRAVKGNRKCDLLKALRLLYILFHSIFIQVILILNYYFLFLYFINPYLMFFYYIFFII